MKNTGIFAAAAACVILAAASLAAAQETKIGVIDFQKVLAESEAGRKVQMQMQERGRGMEGELRELAREIEDLESQLSRDSMVVDEEKRRERQRRLEEKHYEFQERREKFRSRFRRMESKLMGRFQDEVFSIAEEIGREQGYLLILERSAAVYYPESIDLTEQVIEEYDSRHGADLPDKEEDGD